MSWEEFKDYDLIELVEFLELKDDPEGSQWAEDAFQNIVFRYREQLLKDTTVMCRKNQLTETDAEEISNRVFERIWKYPSFRASECNVKDLNRCFRFYLNKIARTVFADHITPDESPFTGNEKIVTSLIDSNVEHTPERLAVLKEREAQLDRIFSKLSYKHKVIYLTYMLHKNEGRYLPRHLLEELKDYLNLSQSSIRVYKKQAIETVNRELHGK